MAKRILVYTNHFYPEQFKINEIVDWLSTKNNHIRVITGIPNYPKGNFYDGYGLFSNLNTNYKKNVIVNRMPLIPRGNGNYFLRSLNYITYFTSTFFFTLYLIIFKPKYDVIFVHHTSPILIAIHPIVYGLFYKTKKISVGFGSVARYFEGNGSNKITICIQISGDASVVNLSFL